MMHEDNPGSSGARQRTTAAAAAAAAASSSAAASSTAAATSASSTAAAAAAPANGTDDGSSSAAAAPTNLLSKVVVLLTLLIKILLYPLRKLSGIVFPSLPYDGLSSSTASDRAARDFVSLLRKHISGDNGAHPFVTSGYRATLTELVTPATTTASSGGSGGGNGPSATTGLMLIYLHSDLHPDSASFCAQTLASARVVTYLHENEASLTCFGTSAQSADGYHLASTLGASAFPFLCLVTVKSSGGHSGGSSSGGRGSSSSNNNPNITLEIRLKLQGRKLLALPPATLLAYLETVARQHRAAVAELEARRLQREEEALLRQEQDREYREALEADRAREAARQAEREKEEAERQASEEAERKEQEEKEEALARAQSLVGDEPPAGTPDTARVRMTLPNGRRIDRRFRADDTVATVRAFLTVHFHEKEVDIRNFALATSFPKRVYDDPTMTLREGDLVPQAVLMVQDLDA